MRQHRLAGQITDRPDVAHRGGAALVDRHRRALHRQVEPFEAEAGNARPAANGNQVAVGGDGARRRARLLDHQRIAAIGQAQRPGAGQHLDAERLESRRHRPHQFGVVERQDAVLRLDHRHLRAELGVGDPEFQPDIARADYRQSLRDLRQGQRFGRGNDAVAERNARQRNGFRAGRQHDMLGVDGLRPGIGLDAAGLAVEHAGMAAHDLDVAALEQAGDAAGETPDDAVLPFDGAGEIQARLFDLEPERRFARLLHGMAVGVGGMNQRLGRNTADIEAGAAQRLPFGQYDVEPELAGADRRDVAAGPAADDQQFCVDVVHLNPR